MRKCDCSEPIPLTKVLLSIGSNLGDSSAVINEAIAIIAEGGFLSNIILSSLYHTDPVGFTDQPQFTNAAITGETTLCPHHLLDNLKQVERLLGRIPRKQWHEREIDIDIILFGDQIVNEEDIQIPHARMHERNFVLVPSAEIAPELINPQTGLTITEMLAQCQDESSVLKI